MKLPIALWICLKSNIFELLLKLLLTIKLDLSSNLMDHYLNLKLPVTVTISLTCKEFYLEIWCKVTQANGTYLRYDNTDSNVSDLPLLVNNSLYSFFYDCTTSANELKNSNATCNFAHTSLVEKTFWTSKEPWNYSSNARDVVLKTIALQKMQLVLLLNEKWSPKWGKFGSMELLELIISPVVSIRWARYLKNFLKMLSWRHSYYIWKYCEALEAGNTRS